MVGLLAGTLGGAAMGKDVIDFNADHKTTTNTGQSILVIDPSAFGDLNVFKQSVDTLASDISQSEKLPGTERIWLPGEQSHERRQQAHQYGIAIAATLIEDLNKLAQELGISPLAARA